jgi:hypothetical protein
MLERKFRILSQKKLQNSLIFFRFSVHNLDGLFHKVNPAFTSVLGMKTRNRGNAFIDFVHQKKIHKTIMEVEISGFKADHKF